MRSKTGRYAAVLAGTVLAVSLNVSGGRALADGDPAAGKARATVCVACHGPSGVSLAPIYPNLACQKELYLVDAMVQYKSGKRDNAIMKPMVAALSEADIANLAAYYSKLGCR